jgi:feruloyl-CoA synthase
VRRLGQALLGRRLSTERPLAILSGNDLEHALLALAALHVGVAYAPISPAYSLVSRDFGKLRVIIDLLTPGLVFAASGRAYEAAIGAAVAPGTELAVTEEAPAGRAATSRSAPIRSENSCSPRARPACPRR